jgi:pimeloyl-ACP methyl ester carboxylesterase
MPGARRVPAWSSKTEREPPEWQFSEAQHARAFHAFANPDYVDVVIHSYRHRLGLAPGAEHLEDIERRLAMQPTIPVPTITLDGMADGNFPATDGTAQSRYFTGRREHRQVPHAGHNLPAEQPRPFVEAILALTPSFTAGGSR